MSYKATVYNIMIAAPGDAAIEVATAARLVKEWDTLHSKERKIKLTHFTGVQIILPILGTFLKTASINNSSAMLISCLPYSSIGLAQVQEYTQVVLAKKLLSPVSLIFQSQYTFLRKSQQTMPTWNNGIAYVLIGKA